MIQGFRIELGEIEYHVLKLFTRHGGNAVVLPVYATDAKVVNCTLP